jgi:hypothetical protein
MLYLNNPSLNVQGLIRSFQENLFPGTSKPPQKFRKKIQSIYFEKTLIENITPDSINSDPRFTELPKLKQALTDIFSNPVRVVTPDVYQITRDFKKSEELLNESSTSLPPFRRKIQPIYFPNLTPEQITPEIIQSDRRFASYPKLKQALALIFNTASDKDTINTQLAKITGADEMPIDIQKHWLKLNQELGYFKDEALLPLFAELAPACRAISALIENNLADEDMPYIYAYRLMALFATQTATPSFEDIAIKTYGLLNQANQQQDKPYHDVILNLIQLPPRNSIRDLDKWLEHIQSQHGFAFLPYFAMAPQIEAQINKKAQINKDKDTDC